MADATTPQPSLPQWLTEQEVADWFRVSTQTMAKLRKKGEPPGHLAHLSPDGRRWIYRRDQLEEWISSRIRNGGTQ